MMTSPRYRAQPRIFSAVFLIARAGSTLRPLLPAAAVAVALLGRTQPLSATTIQVGSAKAAPGQSADICVSLSGGDRRVAGVQMDLGWDGACVSADLAGGTAGACRANPVTGKRVQTNVKGSNLKAFFFSLTDLRPIPDGELFCCSFTLARAASTPCCNVTISGVRGSTATGQAITDIVASGGTICASSPTGASDGQPATAPLPQITAGPVTKPTPKARTHRARRTMTAAPLRPRTPRRSPTVATRTQTPTADLQSGQRTTDKPADR